MGVVDQGERGIPGDRFQQRRLPGVSTLGGCQRVLPVTQVTYATDDFTVETPRCPKCDVPGQPHGDIVDCADALIAYYDVPDVTGNKGVN
jgi:hypothetical protein